MKNSSKFVLGYALVVVLAIIYAFLCLPRTARAETAVTSSNGWHVVMAALPTSLGRPASREAKPGSLTTTVYVDRVVLVNTDSSAHTVTLEDGQGTPGVYLAAASMAANTTWTIDYGGSVFISGIKWSASSALITGSITGH